MSLRVKNSCSEILRFELEVQLENATHCWDKPEQVVEVSCRRSSTVEDDALS